MIGKLKEKYNKCKNKTLLVGGIILALFLIIGGTYALFTITLPINVTNGVYSYSTTCFDILYENDGDINSDSLLPSSTPTGGINGEIALGINPDCNVSATGKIELNIENVSNILTQTVDAHCENPLTLETMTDYDDQTNCETNGGIWGTDGTALKYAMYIGDNQLPSKTGYIKSMDNRIILHNNFDVPTSITDYYIYIWLDGELVDNTYQNQSFSGNVLATVTQISSTYEDKWLSGNSGTLSFVGLDTTSYGCNLTYKLLWSESYNAYQNKSKITISEMLGESDNCEWMAYLGCGPNGLLDGATGTLSIGGNVVNTFECGYFTSAILKGQVGTNIRQVAGTILPVGNALPPYVSSEITHNDDGTGTTTIGLDMYAIFTNGNLRHRFNTSQNIILTDTRP